MKTSALDFVKKHLQYFVYGAVGIVTVVFASVMLAWALKGNIERTVRNADATLVCENLRTEYLVRDTLDLSGVKLDIGGELIDIENCSVTSDLTSAGKKTVSVVYSPDSYLNYTASFEVNVLFVRALEIAEYPHSVTVEDGAATADGLVLYATLAEKPQSDAFGEAEKTDGGYRISLGAGMYASSCTADALVDGYYTLDFYCGDCTESFSFYNAIGKTFIVGSTKDIVTYENASGDQKLSLVVTERDNYKLDCTGSSRGYYLYEGAQNKTIPFAYSLTDTEEVFGSADIEESVGDGVYNATVDGVSFTADAVKWQSAVVDGNIVEHAGFKLVIGSDRRILDFTYRGENVDGVGTVMPEFGDDESVPALKLFVTEYDMNPMLGTGNGYSRGVYVYTDRTGRSFKMTFYLQAFVWTYVPMSSSHGDLYADTSVNDYTYYVDENGNEHWSSFYRGTLYANVSAFVRGEGFLTDVFTAEEEFWLNAILGL